MNLQNLARCVGSTCHDGLLAPGMWDCAWRTPRGVGPPETHPHSQAVVVYAEYSSSTLTPGLQLCKECSEPPVSQHIPPRTGYVYGIHVPEPHEGPTGKTQKARTRKCPLRQICR